VHLLAKATREEHTARLLQDAYLVNTLVAEERIGGFFLRWWAKVVSLHDPTGAGGTSPLVAYLIRLHHTADSQYGHECCSTGGTDRRSITGSEKALVTNP
jgi:hypothetical protein